MANSFRKRGDDFISPGIFEGFMIEIGVADPLQ